MLFDVQAALADIQNAPTCDTRDFRDTPAPCRRSRGCRKGARLKNSPSFAPTGAA